MFCFQCEQTSKGSGCTVRGVCGKEPDVAALQDLLVAVAKGVSRFAHRGRAVGIATDEADRFVVDALFSTVTNVDFDRQRLAAMIHEGVAIRQRTRAAYVEACRAAGQTPESLNGLTTLEPAADLPGLVQQGEARNVEPRFASAPDVASLQEIVAYGLKGVAAYYHHAEVLGQRDDAVTAFIHEALDYLATDPTDIAALTAMALRVGEVNLTVMALLDKANTDTYGHPEPTVVRISPVAGKCILVSGHDLKDLQMILEQTAGKGINVYTHGEMLPCNAYPELKKHKHLVGNFGGAWQDQVRDFAAFPGPIVMTTNCIQKPRDSYVGRIFTTGLVAWPGLEHIAADDAGHKDFTPVIESALASPGFEADAPEQTITIGFARNAVLGVADKVIDAVKAGAIRRFFLIAGCDAPGKERSYYTDLAQSVPDDCVVLTLACGKYRFNTHDFGTIGGIPRLLDMGQCNDAYSAIQVAVALANAFECSVNDLPLSLVLSWYEQKAVCILLSLLHLGIRDIRIGPSLPAFISPNVLALLQENFALKPTTTASEDLAAMLG